MSFLLDMGESIVQAGQPFASRRKNDRALRDFYESPLQVKCIFCSFRVAVAIPIFYPSVTNDAADSQPNYG